MHFESDILESLDIGLSYEFDLLKIMTDTKEFTNQTVLITSLCSKTQFVCQNVTRWLPF